MSKHLNPTQLKGIEKVGACLIPGHDDLPSFARSGCAGSVDRVLGCMPAGDLSDLKLLLTLLGVAPRVVVRVLLAVLELAPGLPSFLPGVGLLRFIRIGLRGLVMTLYYAEPAVLAALGYQVAVYTDDLVRKNSDAARGTSSPEP